MTAQHKIPDIAERVERLRADVGDKIPIDDISNVVEAIMASMDGDLSALELRVQQEILDLVSYIKQARAEIAAVQPIEIRDHDIPVATDELDAVVSTTENATTAILDAVEALEALTSDVPDELAIRLVDIATRIYEASNFQDITGQRITKVVKTLKHIEERISHLAEVLGDAAPNDGVSTSPPAAAASDADLLSGPQLEGEGNSQDDIDALFDKLD